MASLPILLAQNDDAWAWIAGLGATVVCVGGFAVIFSLFLVIVFFIYGKAWLQAYMSRADVSMFSLIGMSLRQVNSRMILNAKIMAAQAGLDISRRDGISTRRLEAHYLAGGNVLGVVNAVIAAHRAGIDLDTRFSTLPPE